MSRHVHKFHLVDPSPWPLFAAFSSLSVTIGGVLYMHFFKDGFKLLILGLIGLILILSLWWRDVIRESTFQNHHTDKVQNGLRIGFIAFILSEVMFFLAFFWAFFHSSISPAIEIGCVWPPIGLKVFSPFQVPLLNTIILLTSGATITLTHYYLLAGERDLAYRAFGATIGLAILFTFFQGLEYFEAPFSISEGIYGSVFFMATGFHGFHVIIGTIFITVSFIRYALGHYYPHLASILPANDRWVTHLGFEFAAWYWHFVDVVWLFLYIFIYFWGNL